LEQTGLDPQYVRREIEMDGTPISNVQKYIYYYAEQQRGSEDW